MVNKYEDLEFYCCWDYDYDYSFEDKIELDIRTISLAKNYIGLKERQFITFKKKEAEIGYVML